MYDFSRRIAIFILLGSLPCISFAYVDPGSGILMWQGLIAAVGALLMFVRNPIKFCKDKGRRLKALLKRTKINEK